MCLMERSQIQKHVLEGMNKYSNEMYWATIFDPFVESYDGYFPQTFEPSLGDRMLFRQIVERRMSDIEKEIEKCPEIGKDDLEKFGLVLLLEEFYPKYGDYKIMGKQEMRNGRRIILGIYSNK